MAPNETPLPDVTDLLIVGGGVMGTSAAYFFATETDREVTLVEKDAIAAGSSGDSSAIVRHHYGDQEIYTRLAWWSHRFYREFEERTGKPIAYEGNPFVRFADADNAEYVQAGREVLADNDIPVSRVDASEFPDAFPMFEGLDRYDFAVTDEEAAYSDGTDVATGFASAAREAGATVVTGVEVTDVRTGDGGVVGVETNRKPVDCEELLVAVGPWTPRLAETVGVDVPITPTREDIVILDPPEEYAAEFPDLVPTTGLPGGKWYIRPDFGEGILVGTHRLTEACDPDAYRQQPTQEAMVDLVDRVSDILPDLERAGVKGKYSGVYSVTPDHDFIIDEAGPDGFYLACGFSGHGFKHAPAVGKLLVDLVTEGTSDLADLGFFSLSRFDDDPHGHGAPDDNI